MKVLILGDVVGSPGRKALKALLPDILEKEKCGFCIINGENAAGGSGLTPQVTDEIFESGADVITSGDHIWRKREIFEYFDVQDRLIRPANYPGDSPGHGSVVVTADNGMKVGVINVIGRVFMPPVDCPFRSVDDEIRKIKTKAQVIFVDFHAEATSEKIAMGWHVDGRVTCLFGTHTHVQTADERVLPEGTAYITDLGMTGPHDSVIGREKDKVLKTFVTRLPERFPVAQEDVKVCGIIVGVDDKTGKASSIKRKVYFMEGK